MTDGEKDELFFLKWGRDHLIGSLDVAGLLLSSICNASAAKMQSWIARCVCLRLLNRDSPGRKKAGLPKRVDPALFLCSNFASGWVALASLHMWAG